MSCLVFLYCSVKLKWAELVAHSDKVRNIYTHIQSNLLERPYIEMSWYLYYNESSENLCDIAQ